MAVQAGVDTIEHGGWLDEEAVAEMATRGTWYIPTFAVYRWHGTIGPAFKQARAAAMRQDHLKSFELARGARHQDRDGHRHRRVRLRRYGARVGVAGRGPDSPPGEAIEVSTRRSAECMRLGREVGTLETGKRADLLVVDGNPLLDITMLRRKASLALVMKDGVAFSGPLSKTLA